MNKVRLNIIAAIAVFAGLAGCTTTAPLAYSHGTPIMSAADARTMIQVEVKEIDPTAEAPVLIAASDQRAR